MLNINEFYNELKTELECNQDGFFMITPSDDKKELDDAYQKFNAQNSDQKLKADTRSLALYGLNNYDHYHILLSKVKKGTEDEELNGLEYNRHDEEIVKEDYTPGSIIFNCEYFGTESPNELFEKIDSAKEFNIHTTGRVIIYPTQSLEELEALYTRYMALDIDSKASSDNKAQEMFGKTNREIYQFTKDKIIIAKNDEIEGAHNVKDEDIDKNVKHSSLFTNDTPLLTPDELSQKIEEDYSCFKEEDKKVIKSWRESYALLGEGIKIPEYNKYNLQRINILRRAIYENNNDAIIQCGWIPGIEFNSENRIKASKIVREKMDKDYGVISYNTLNESYIEESTNEEKKAVSIVLVSGNSWLGKTIKKVQGIEFSHASISLDDDLKRIYSFNQRNGFNGLSYESMKQYAKEGVDKVGVYTFLVSNSVYKKLEKALDNFNLHIKETKYSVLNLLTIPLHIPLDMDMKMVCSEFVDKLLKQVNLDLTNKKSYFVSPKDFSDKVKNDSKIVEVFYDHPKNYNSSKIKNRIQKLKKSNFPIFESMEYNELLTEAKSFPIQFDKEGNLLVKNIKKIDFEQEYTNSHRLLMEYDKSNSYEPMKFELSKMQFFITLLDKKIYKQGKDKSVSELKVRARFLNDFKKYMKILMKAEPTFNFTEYYNNSTFNDAIIQIDNNTLKYGWKALKYMIK